MTKKQIAYHGFLIKKAHINKHKKFNNDEDRKAYLKSRYNETSLKNMSIGMLMHFNAFLTDDLEKLEKLKQKQNGYASYNQITMIENIWKKYSKKKTKSSLVDFIFKITKKKPLYIKNLTIKQASNVILALKGIERENKERIQNG